jgi:hypothetical protein
MNLKTNTFVKFQNNEHLHCICELMKQSVGNIVSHHGCDLLKRTYVNEPWKSYLETSSPTFWQSLKILLARIQGNVNIGFSNKSGMIQHCKDYLIVE